MRRTSTFIILTAFWALFIAVLWTVRMEDAITITTKTPWQPFTMGLRYVVAPWFLTFLVAACGWIIGDWILGSRVPKGGIRDVYLSGFGMSVIAVATFLIGLAGGLYPIAFILEAAVIVGIGWRRLMDLFVRIGADIKGISKWRLEEIVMMGMILWYVYVTIGVVCNPSLGWDIGNSHLAAPKWYLKEHTIHFLPWINFNNFPQLVEMLIMLVMSGVGDPGGTTAYLFLLGQCFIIYALVQDRTAGLIAVLIWLSMPFATRYSQEDYVEMTLAFYCLLSVYALLAWKRVDLAGLVGGAALSVKYTAAPFIFLLVFLTNKKDWWKFPLWCAPIAAAWYIRNIFLFGNPVFPFMDSFARIPGVGSVQDPVRAELIINQFDMLKNFRLPWNAIPGAIWWATMTEREPWVHSGRPASTGPWLLALLPVMVIALKKKTRWPIVAVSIAYMLYWVAVERIWDSRYLVAIWPLFCVFAGWGIKEVMRWFKK